ncbi:MAG: NADH-quinone oxidoreductase subunit C [Candidatus Bathyarchaeota archaeon]|nr:MAG: NADH-quinone oxidoreductase subunit C [Candidatus Bathyarchaeota archaeon]
MNSIGFTHLSTITGCQNSEGSIEILYHFENQGTLVTVRVSLPINVGSLSTITDIVPGSVLYEREIHDLFGIKFEGHPDLSRLILPDEWPNESYPLNKNTSSLTTQK